MRISDWSSDVCSSDLLDPCDGRIKAGPIGNIERYGKCFAALVGNRLCRVRDLFHYSAYHLADIADTARDVDLAIRWGYGWRLAPFETWQPAGGRRNATGIQEELAAGKPMANGPLRGGALGRHPVGPPVTISHSVCRLCMDKTKQTNNHT